MKTKSEAFEQAAGGVGGGQVWAEPGPLVNWKMAFPKDAGQMFPPLLLRLHKSPIPHSEESQGG